MDCQSIQQSHCGSVVKIFGIGIIIALFVTHDTNSLSVQRFLYSVLCLATYVCSSIRWHQCRAEVVFLIFPPISGFQQRCSDHRAQLAEVCEGAVC